MKKNNDSINLSYSRKKHQRIENKMFRLSENEIKTIFSLYETQQLVHNIALFIYNESEIKKHQRVTRSAVGRKRKPPKKMINPIS